MIQGWLDKAGGQSGRKRTTPASWARGRNCHHLSWSRAHPFFTSRQERHWVKSSWKKLTWRSPNWKDGRWEQGGGKSPRGPGQDLILESGHLCRLTSWCPIESMIFFFNFYWSIVALQCWLVSEKWINCIYISPLFVFPSRLGHHRALSRVLCAIQQVLINYPFYTCAVTESCPALCKPMDCSLPGSSVHGIFQAEILQWVAISYFWGSSQPRDRTHVSCVSCIGRWILYHWHHLQRSFYTW